MADSFAGKRALVMGVANKRSIAWAIAQRLAAGGAELAFTFQGERIEKNVRELAASVSSPLVTELDVRDETFLSKDRIPVGEGLNSWVVRHHQPLLIGSVADEARFGVKAVADTKPTESWLGVPMIVRDRVIGVISIESVKKSAFTQDDVILLTAIANQAAVAIENAHLYKDLEGLTYALEQRVMERTNELRETNLRLMAADRSKNQFLANMSHELRTPLNSMLLLSHLLSENELGNLSDKQVEQLRTVHSAGRDLLGLINEVLDLSKIEAGKQDVTLESIELSHFVSYVRRLFEATAGQKGVELVTELDVTAPSRIVTDRQRVERILTNLLSNALKFTHHGAVTISATADKRDRTVQLSVVDTGIGIAPADQERIFEDFRQLDNSPTRAYGGTGLGLSICRRLAQMLDGRISVQSQMGHGSTFTLTLPTKGRR